MVGGARERCLNYEENDSIILSFYLFIDKRLGYQISYFSIFERKCDIKDVQIVPNFSYHATQKLLNHKY